MFNATITRRIDLTEELVIFWVKPDAPFPEFTPGQYVALALPGSAPRPAHFPPEKEAAAPEKLIKRAYSIGSTPLEREYLEFYIAIVPDGALTSRLALTKEGDRVFCAPKITGTFVLKPIAPDHNLILISTGTGIAPYLSMVRTPSTWSEGRSITIIHGVRYPKDLAYREELEAMEQSGKPLRYLPVVSRDPQFPGVKGHVQKLFHEGIVVLNPEVDNVFLCGNPAMIDEVQGYLLERNYVEHTKRQHGNLHLERYW